MNASIVGIALLLSVSLASASARAQDAAPGCDAACLSAAVHDVAIESAPANDRSDSVSNKGVLLFTPGVSVPPPNAKPVFIPKGTIFAVQTMQSYSAFGTPPGGKIRYELVQDVVVGGQLIAMKGDTAEGFVQAGTRGGFP